MQNLYQFIFSYSEPKFKKLIGNDELFDKINNEFTHGDKFASIMMLPKEKQIQLMREFSNQGNEDPTELNNGVHYIQRKGYSPNHKLAANALFQFDKDNESDEIRAKREANLLDAIAHVADQNELSRSDVMHIFPFILRMLKSKSEWAE